MGFSFTFYNWFKPQYSLVLMSCVFMGFWYRFISFLLHPRLGLNLLKNSELSSLPSNPLKGKEKERQRD